MSSLFKPLRVVSTLVLLLFLTTTIYFFRQSAPSNNGSAKIAILCMTSEETNYDWMTISNKYKYSVKHSYDLNWNFAPPTVISNYAKQWDKLDMVRDAVQATLSGKKNYEWLWMLDYDTLITNPEIRIEQIIERSLAFAENEEGKSMGDIDLILTKDCEPVNVGSFFVRVSPWILDLVEEWRGGRQDELPNRTEQDVLRDMLLDDTLGTAGRSVMVPQTWFNAYPDELGHCRDERDGGGWEEGMFLIHFPGAEFWLKEEGAVGRLMRKYWERAFPRRKLG